MNCPKCQSADIRSSRSPGWVDAFQRARGRDAFRCRDCRSRFFARDSGEPANKADPKALQKSKQIRESRRKRRLARRMLIISIFAVAFAIFFFFLRYLTTERAPSSDSGRINSYPAFSLG